MSQQHSAAKNRELPEKIYGRTASAGHALGTALPIEKELNFIRRSQPEDETPEEALGRFEQAVEASKVQLRKLQGDPGDDYYDVASLIFSFHLLMLDDDAFTGQMREAVRRGKSPEDAVREVARNYAGGFTAMREGRIAEKAQDVRDVGYRLLVNLAGRAADGEDFCGRIAIARHIFPSELVRLATERIEGAVLFGTGVTAHIAILSKSLGLPVMITQDRRLFDIPEGEELFLDASEGHLFIHPTGDLRARAKLACSQEEEKRSEQAEEASAEQGAVTEDGTAVTLLANVNIHNDAVRARNAGAQGIGLYRSEFPFIIRNEFLSEEQQFRLYRQVVDAFPAGEVILRTADIGGDKLMAGQEEEERNPFLGVRGIRFSLAYPDEFRKQLRAMLRAGANRELKIMFPMVASPDGVARGREFVEQARLELEKKGVPHCTSPKVGAMVELPSAVITIQELAAQTDFLSIGTNDLIMYMLAVDRTNERLSELYRSHHPVVLRTLSMIAEGAGENIGELSVCGDSAGDPLMVPFYLGLGIRKLSLSPSRLRPIRNLLRGITIEQSEKIAEEMLEIEELSEMDRYLKELESSLGF
ncbi:MAG: phosphoenolpyruvate--protein phosphotransferase [Spirochaetaceae bacterium]